jgi:hypothetical protein
MIAGLALNDLAAKIVNDARAKRDFVVPTPKLVATESGLLTLTTDDERFNLTPTKFALRQIGDHAGIPAKYVDRMAADAPDLLAKNLNHWFTAQPANRMVRTHINGSQTLRAFLSEKYRSLDNDDLAAHILPILMQAGWVIKSAQVTETKLYIQAISEGLAAEIKAAGTGGHGFVKTHIIHPGVVISNSEVGAGRLSIESLLYDEFCTNGMMIGASLRRNHVGKALGGDGGFGSDDNASEYFSDETRRLDDAVLWSKVRDVLVGTVDDAKFQAVVGKLQKLTDVKLDGSVQEVVEVTAKNYGLAQSETESILQHFIEGADLSAFGLVQAMTRTAQDAENYDRAIEIERFGGQMFAEYSKN